ncbi:MAG TPA: PEGA domain-containing protein [Flavobacteriia bacterium]|nr:PEGA domain-containing protein [Flavobacteriia bacterium]
MKAQLKYLNILLLILFFSSCSEDKIDYTGQGKITGKVIEKDSFVPLENAKVTINATNNSVFTDENGEFEFIDIPEGEYSIEAIKEEYVNGFEPVTVTAEQTVNIIIELQRSDALNEAPSNATLISPEDNATNVNIETTLSWNPAIDPEDDPITYRIEIRNDVNNDLEIIENITDTSYHLTNLVYGVKYFWQVVASDGVNDDVYSETFAFETLAFPNNRFLFTRIINGNNVIFSSDENGNEIQLTNNNDNCWRPRKNLITNKIAFLKIVNGETHLFSMDIDGSNQIQITTTIQPIGFKNTEIDFSWSTNGDQLIYPHFDKLYKINADGSGNQQIYQTIDARFITECVWSNDGNYIVLKTNNSSGYNASIFTIDMAGSIINIVADNILGALGGIDISIDNQKILYTRDMSEYEDATYRQLDSHLFVFNTTTGISIDYSNYKTNGTNDLDPKFSPNEAEIIVVNTANDGISEKNIFTVRLDNEQVRTELFNNALMPAWQ